jgi:hypothetical protein
MAERGGEAAASSSAHCLTLVVLGAAGDLARKKTYPALHKLYDKVTTRPPTHTLNTRCLATLTEESCRRPSARKLGSAADTACDTWACGRVCPPTERGLPSVANPNHMPVQFEWGTPSRQWSCLTAAGGTPRTGTRHVDTPASPHTSLAREEVGRLCCIESDSLPIDDCLDMRRS